MAVCTYTAAVAVTIIALLRYATKSHTIFREAVFLHVHRGHANRANKSPPLNPIYVPSVSTGETQRQPIAWRRGATSTQGGVCACLMWVCGPPKFCTLCEYTMIAHDALPRSNYDAILHEAKHDKKQRFGRIISEVCNKVCNRANQSLPLTNAYAPSAPTRKTPWQPISRWRKAISTQHCIVWCLGVFDVGVCSICNLYEM